MIHECVDIAMQVDERKTVLGQTRTPEPSPFKRPFLNFASSPYSTQNTAFEAIKVGNKRGSSMAGIPSPPPSPYIARQLSTVPAALGPTFNNRDPILFDLPSNDENSQPLFELSERYSPLSISDKVSLDTIPPNPKATTKLTTEPIESPSFRSSIWKDCLRNPSEFFRNEREILMQQLKAAKSVRVIMRHPTTPRTPIATLPKSQHRPRSSISSQSSISKEKVRVQRRTDKIVKPKFSRQSKPIVAIKRDVHYSTIEDVTPSTNFLTDNPRCLHVDWSGSPTDLSDDPDRELLHRAELHLASTLKLTCGQYLTQKRLIFLERVTRLRANNPVFSRTHAQQVCHIDVNKASRLFAAFEKVGWLSRDALKQYL